MRSARIPPVVARNHPSLSIGIGVSTPFSGSKSRDSRGPLPSRVSVRRTVSTTRPYASWSCCSDERVGSNAVRIRNTRRTSSTTRSNGTGCQESDKAAHRERAPPAASRSFARLIRTRHGGFVGCILGVLASASTLRSRVVPVPSAVAPADDEDSKPAAPGCRYRTWAELLAALGIDALECPKCAGRMRVLRLVREEHDIRKKLAAMGEATEPPARAPARAPPYWASRALRIRADADAA